MKTITEHLKDSKSLYSVLDKVTGCSKERKIPTNKSNIEIAEELATFYTEKISRIRENISTPKESMNSSLVPCSNATITNSFNNFFKITETEFDTILSQMNNKTSNSDPVPTSIIKQSSNIIKAIILHIINNSLQNHVFPDALKNDLITPVIKDEKKRCGRF